MKYKLLIFLVIVAGCNQQNSDSTELRDRRTLPSESTALHAESPKRLVVQNGEWWQPTTVTTHANGSVFMEFESAAAKAEYYRQQQLTASSNAALAPDSATYVFDDSFNGTGYTVPRQDNGARDKIGIDQGVNSAHADLIPQFQQIGADNSNRMSSFTGPRLAAIQACNPHYWNVAIESVNQTANGLSIEVSVTCGSRLFGLAAEMTESWTFANGQLSLSRRSEVIPSPPKSY
jgi:hypothetical protein